jgi:hypothetical protein
MKLLDFSMGKETCSILESLKVIKGQKILTKKDLCPEKTISKDLFVLKLQEIVIE